MLFNLLFKLFTSSFKLLTVSVIDFKLFLVNSISDILLFLEVISFIALLRLVYFLFKSEIFVLIEAISLVNIFVDSSSLFSFEKSIFLNGHEEFELYGGDLILYSSVYSKGISSYIFSRNLITKYGLFIEYAESNLTMEVFLLVPLLKVMLKSSVSIFEDL